jgi:hypothetical protein
MTRPLFGVLRHQNSSNFTYSADYSEATSKIASKHGMGMFLLLTKHQSCFAELSRCSKANRLETPFVAGSSQKARA